MIRQLVRSDVPAMVELWQSFYPEKYWIDGHQLETHFFDSGFAIHPASVGVFDGDTAVAFATVKAPPGPECYSAYPGQANLQSFAFSQSQVGAAVLTHVIESIGGFEKVVFGQDNRHFFPGVPVECTRLASFLQEAGFQRHEGLANDLERDLEDYEVPDGVSVHHEGVDFRVCTAGDKELVLDFFKREFPERWRYDVMTKWDLDGPHVVMAMFEAGKCEGFALIQNEPCHAPIGGAVWKRDLGAHWGSLGPIGVSAGVRGRGLGHAMLAAGLLELQRRGCRQTIIDWTTLVDFYGRHGFVVNRQYETFSLSL